MIKKNVLLIGFIGIISVTACSSTESNTSEDAAPNATQNAPSSVVSIYEDLKVAEFKEKLNNSPEAIILDVRTPGEFSAGSIEGAINIDYYSDSFSKDLDALDKSKPIFVYCKSGGRSQKAKMMLQDKEFQEVYNLLGGYMAWSK